MPDDRGRVEEMLRSDLSSGGTACSSVKGANAFDMGV